MLTLGRGKAFSLSLSVALSFVTLISFFILSSSSIFASDHVSNVSVTVPVSCNITSTLDTAHTATINPGQVKADIGTTTFKVFCNDNTGYAIYAIGYSNEEYGNTNLLPTNTSNPAIATGLATSGSTSNWAMKLTPVTEQSSGTSQPYVPTIESDTNGSFASYHVVPEEYTKVATFTSTTDFTIGSSLTSTYRAYIQGMQPADTYSGKVKYTLVHPNDAPAPKPEIPESQTATLKGGVSFNEFSYLVNELPEGFTPADNNILSVPDSPNPVYRYYDSTDGYYKIYTPAKKIYMNAYSYGLFRECDGGIDDDFFRLLDSSRVTNMESMFEGCTGYNNSLLANWDVSNVTNMSSMFSSADGYGPGTFSDLSPLANWDVSNVTNMSGMFAESNCSEETCHIKSLDPLSNWDTSSVTNMFGMFYGATSLTDISGARNWNTSNVTNIIGMFSGANNIDATVLNNWDVSKVTNKSGAFTCPVAQQPCWYNNTTCPTNNGNSNSNSNNNNSTSGTNSSPNTNNAPNSTSPSNSPASPSNITDDIISNTDSTPNFNQDSSISTISPTNSTNYTNSSNPTSTDEYRSDVIEGSPNTTSPQGEMYYSNTKKVKFNILPLILIIISIIAFLFGLHFFILARRKEEDDSTK